MSGYQIVSSWDLNQNIEVLTIASELSGNTKSSTTNNKPNNNHSCSNFNEPRVINTNSSFRTIETPKNKNGWFIFILCLLCGVLGLSILAAKGNIPNKGSSMLESEVDIVDSTSTIVSHSEKNKSHGKPSKAKPIVNSHSGNRTNHGQTVSEDSNPAKDLTSLHGL